MLGMVKNDATKHVLDPTCGSGRRLVAIMGRDTFEKYERMNLLKGDEWRRFGAKRASHYMRRVLEGRTVMVLGNAVWEAMNLHPSCAWFKGVEQYGATYYRVPHPSGMNIQYNSKETRDMARELFQRVADG